MSSDEDDEKKKKRDVGRGKHSNRAHHSGAKRPRIEDQRGVGLLPVSGGTNWDTKTDAVRIIAPPVERAIPITDSSTVSSTASNELAAILSALAASNSVQLPSQSSRTDANRRSTHLPEQQSGGTRSGQQSSPSSLSAATEHRHQNLNPLSNAPVVQASMVPQETPFTMLARIMALQDGGPHQPQQSEHQASQLSEISHQAGPLSIASLLSQNHNIPASTIQDIFRQSAQQSSLQSTQPSYSLPFNPSMGPGPYVQSQQSPFLHLQTPNNSQWLNLLTSLLSTQLQGHNQAPPSQIQQSTANALTNLILSSMSQQQQQQLQLHLHQQQQRQQQAHALNNLLYAPSVSVASAVPQGQQPTPLHPQLLALLNSFAASAAASNPSPAFHPPAAPTAAAAANQPRCSTNDGNISGSSGSGSDELAMALSGRSPVVMYIPDSDERSLSEYQCLVRKQIELFEANEEDVECQTQGRNKPIFLGQVGIRCRHCTSLLQRHRARGAVFYPSKIRGIYQAAQNMANTHLSDQCQHIPADLKALICQLQSRKSSAGGGKTYWEEGLRVHGVFEDSDGLRFERR